MPGDGKFRLTPDARSSRLSTYDRPEAVRNLNAYSTTRIGGSDTELPRYSLAFEQIVQCGKQLLFCIWLRHASLNTQSLQIGGVSVIRSSG